MCAAASDISSQLDIELRDEFRSFNRNSFSCL
jgi:hypothetical protein